MLFSAVIPTNICLCIGCHCENSLGNGLVKDEVLPLPESNCNCREEKCRNDNDAESKCFCTNVLKAIAVQPNTVSPVKKLKFDLSRDTIAVTVPPFGSVDAVGLAPHFGTRRLSFYPHVPLHVILCVFLN